MRTRAGYPRLFITNDADDLYNSLKIGRHGQKYHLIPEVAAKANGIVQSVKTYIARNLDQEEMSRDVIAAQALMNPDYLSRIFKRETGLSISDYVLQERIARAKELLSKTEMPVSSVATAVGYSNFSHFTKIFRKYTDRNPMDYRQYIHIQSSDQSQA